MLLAEDLLLLVTNDATGRLSVPSSQADAGLGGANLLELTLLGKVDVSGPQDQGKPGRIVVRDPSPPGDEILDAALQVLIGQQGKKPSAVIRPLGRNLRPALYQRLAATACSARRSTGSWASSRSAPGPPRTRARGEGYSSRLPRR